MISNQLRREYDHKHKFCPECGHWEHEQTCVGYFIEDENSQDLNKSSCTRSKCGWEGTVHDRIESPILSKMVSGIIRENVNEIVSKYAFMIADDETMIDMENEIKAFLESGKSVGIVNEYVIEFDDMFMPIITFDGKYVMCFELDSADYKEVIQNIIDEEVSGNEE